MNLDDIGGILSGLSDEEFSALNEMAEQFLGKEEQNNEAADNPGGPDMQTVAKIMQLLPLIQGGTDNEKTRFIAALKPLLSPKRRKKADEAIRIMQLTEVLSLLNSGFFE